MKNTNEAIGNRTRNLLACSAVLQSPALPRILRAIFLPFLRSDRQFLIYLTFTFFVVNIVSWNWMVLFRIFEFMRAINACDGTHICMTNFYELIYLLLVTFPHFPRFSLCRFLYCPEVTFTVIHRIIPCIIKHFVGGDVFMTKVNRLSFYISFVSSLNWLTFWLLHIVVCL